KAMALDQRARRVDVALRDVDAVRLRGREHASAAEDLDLVFRRARAGAHDLGNRQEHRVVRVAAVERVALGASRTLGQHAMAHGARAQARMPEGYGDAGAEQGTDASDALAE